MRWCTVSDLAVKDLKCARKDEAIAKAKVLRADSRFIVVEVTGPDGEPLPRSEFAVQK